MKTPITYGKLAGKTIVFSGFRDKDMERKINKEGGEVSNSLTKKTSILLIKDINDETSKTEKAKKMNILILPVIEFTNIYL